MGSQYQHLVFQVVLFAGLQDVYKRQVYRNTEIKTILFISYPFLSDPRYFLRDFPVEKSRKGMEWGKEFHGKMCIRDRRGAASAGLFSSADRAYMKAPVSCPTLQLVDKVSRGCGHTPGKVAGQRATVKAEMNGFTPGLDRRPPSR